MPILVKIFKNVDFGQNFKNIDFVENCRKIWNFVKFVKISILDKIVENSRFWSKFNKMSILVKIFKKSI